MALPCRVQVSEPTLPETIHERTRAGRHRTELVLSHRLASVLVMDIIVGLLIWGGLLALVSRWVMRVYRRPSPRTAVAPAQPATPAARPSIAPAAVEESAREAGALVDGLIIGHHLTRGHYQDRLDEQAETIDGLRAEVAADTYFGDDDLDDLGDVDDLGGYGTVGFVDGFEGAEAHEFEGLGAGGDPWDDDVFGDDEDD